MIKKCKKHPKYKAIHKPRVECKDCWGIYKDRHPVEYWKYEVVWLDNNKMYVWSGLYEENISKTTSGWEIASSDALFLPEDVKNVYDIVSSFGKTVMVFLLKNGSMCTYATGTFGNANEWLEMQKKKLSKKVLQISAVIN